MCGHDLHDGTALTERVLTGEQTEECCPEAVDIRACVCLCGFELFGAHVLRRPKDLPDSRDTLLGVLRRVDEF